MKKWVCPICGYVEEGEKAPEFCPICKCPGEKFTEQAEDLTWAAEQVLHRVLPKRSFRVSARTSPVSAAK